MKSLQKIIVVFLTILVNNLIFSQTIVIPDYVFRIEPFKPIYHEYEAFRGVGELIIDTINGQLIHIKETEEEYNKRNAEHKQELYSEYLNSSEYKSWQKEHLEWRKKRPNWKNVTRYPELISELEKTFVKPTASKGETYTVNSNTLNVRSEPNKNSSIISTLKMGDEINLVNADNGDWWFVKNEDIQGYVFAQFLKINPYSGWEKKHYLSGTTPECENVSPKYDYNLDNFLKISVGSGTDVVVKLMKKGNNEDECIRVVYVRSMDTYEVKNIPEGLYYLKIAYGKDYRQKKVDNQCYLKFMQDAQYEKGVEILDFNKVKQPDKIIGNEIFENWSLPCFELSLDVRVARGIKSTFNSSGISELEFNK